MALLQCKFYYFCGFYCCEVTSQVIKDAKVKFNGGHKDLIADKDGNYLKSTDCTFAEFPVNSHETFPNLQVLWVNECKLEVIERRHLHKLTALGTVWITKCNLKKLKGDIFRDLKKLEYISFRHNMIEEIDPSILDGLEKLKKVNFRRNVNINMKWDATEPDGNTLDELKHEIENNCKPKPTENAAIYGSLSKILEDPAFKDFTVNVGQSSFKVHKLIFAARSATLADLFRKEPEATKLNLQDIPESTFAAIYEFIYNNRLHVDADYVEIFSAASRLKIDDLRELVAARLIENIDEGNSFDLLVLGNKFDHEKLREKAFENIRTKVFPDRKLDDELAKQPEKMKKLIEMKKQLDQAYEEMINVD